MTMTLIQTQTLASTQTAIEFVSIPQTYTDLLLLCSIREGNSDTYVLNIEINGSAANLTERYLQGSGSSVTSSSTSNLRPIVNPSAAGSTFGSLQIYIPNYTGSTNKSISMESVSEENQTTSFQRLTAGLWSNSAAITSFKITGGAGAGNNLAANSTASLYGILKGSGGATVS